ncbi:ABC transporter ATP-binding protein [Thermococcus peptonophilus]|uniref:ABC transporter domain-containing protein n=1 Tax=Thermococcus peptonophilus TaxID=53952 RepID=A0A142CVN5_9EURY|nr:ABC transporter ATP-binding protein [Thermococcus peptonophilus]AMQ18837.1 hypothetical protein A0127_06440 [Thermococcus peptonophilus]
MKVKVDNLVKVYGDVIALKNVTLSFKAGNIYVLLGPNGAGKTTLVKIISGLIPPTSGDVYVNGLSVTENPSSARNMLRFVPQEPALDWLLSVYDNLYYYAWLLGLPKAERKRAVERVLKKFNLSDYSNFAINQLSGGLQRRVQIARAFLDETRPLLILDEPTIGVDPVGKLQIWELIKDETSSGDILTIVCTNDLSEAEFLGDIIVLLNKKVIRVLKKEDIALEDSVEIVTSSESIIVNRRELNKTLLSLIYDGIEIRSVSPKRPSLMDVFREYFGGGSE